ncbi:MAG: hypothetical protein ABDH25_02195, partial [Dictyoglomaceae bacterium]
FAAGAMIYVVIEELIPEAQKAGETDLPTLGALIGFSIMMFLDLALGLKFQSCHGNTSYNISLSNHGDN